jgi:hypothetical protein
MSNIVRHILYFVKIKIFQKPLDISYIMMYNNIVRLRKNNK